ncbi:hypothetical protein D3C72_1834170 [compost metagenome]
MTASPNSVSDQTTSLAEIEPRAMRQLSSRMLASSPDQATPLRVPVKLSVSCAGPSAEASIWVGA